VHALYSSEFLNFFLPIGWYEHSPELKKSSVQIQESYQPIGKGELELLSADFERVWQVQKILVLSDRKLLIQRNNTGRVIMNSWQTISYPRPFHQYCFKPLLMACRCPFHDFICTGWGDQL
jgi:hypothetical protein